MISYLQNIGSKTTFSSENFNIFNWRWVDSVDSEPSGTAAGVSPVHTLYWDQTNQQVKLELEENFKTIQHLLHLCFIFDLHDNLRWVFPWDEGLQTDYRITDFRCAHVDFCLLVCVIFLLLKLPEVTMMMLCFHISENMYCYCKRLTKIRTARPKMP